MDIQTKVIVYLLAFGLIYALLALLLKFWGKGKNEIDYKALLLLGIVWFPLGLIFNNLVFFITGFFYICLGLINRGIWQEQPPLTSGQKTMTVISVVLACVILFTGIAAYYAG
jgi:hypothetical protein